MGGISFTFEGKDYDIYLEGGYPMFENEEEEEAFLKWRKTPEGIQCFGPVPTDWTKEHYLDDRYPFDMEKERRIDPENEEDSEPYIDWCEYEKCRYGCYKQFYYRGEHDCIYCGVISCTPCAIMEPGAGRSCVGERCKAARRGKAWICAEHSDTLCPGCKEDEEERNNEKK